LTGKTKEPGENLPQYHFVHHKSRMISPATEPGPPSASFTMVDENGNAGQSAVLPLVFKVPKYEKQR
jgi:hypothetical protein